MVHLGKTVKYIRERKGLSQGNAARLLGISQVHLSNVENNKSWPSPELIDRIRDAWGVDPYILAWCLFGDVNELPKPVRKPMIELGQAWKKELGDLLPENDTPKS